MDKLVYAHNDLVLIVSGADTETLLNHASYLASIQETVDDDGNEMEYFLAYAERWYSQRGYDAELKMTGIFERPILRWLGRRYLGVLRKRFPEKRFHERWSISAASAGAPHRNG